MQRDFLAYILDVLQSCELIVGYTAGMDLASYEGAAVVRDAVERRFEIIGEALTRCRIHYPQSLPELGDVQPIVDFRNYLAHRYDTVSSEVVWDIVQNDIPPLASRMQAILNARSSGEQTL